MIKRIETLQQKLKELDLEGFLVVSPVNRKYLTGFTGTAGWVLLTQKQIYLFVDFRYVEQAKMQAKHCHVIQMMQHSPELTLRRTMEDLDLYTLGVEQERCTLDDYEKLVAQFRKKAVVPVKGFVEEIRKIKSQDEIDLIYKAQQIGDRAFSHIINIIKPGISEKDIALELEFFMRKQGADKLSFDSIIASGKRSALPHGVATDKRIEYGDFVTLDFGCIYQGYCSDMTRTIVVGKVDEKQEEVYNLVLKAQLEALANIKAGVIGKDIDLISRNIFKAAGYDQYFGHGLGHSLGMEIHEAPNFNTKEEGYIVENMVLSVEPGLYLPNWGGVRIEDVIVVKNDGYINLTQSSKELIVL